MTDETAKLDLGLQTQERLYATDDVAVWAEEFIRIASTHIDPMPDWLDEGTMIAWFANLIETHKTLQQKDEIKSEPGIIQADPHWDRERALHLAIDLHKGQDPSTNSSIISTARTFERYLKGEDAPGK